MHGSSARYFPTNTDMYSMGQQSRPDQMMSHHQPASMHAHQNQQDYLNYKQQQQMAPQQDLYNSQANPQLNS